jgi:hypothetical protein
MESISLVGRMAVVALGLSFVGGVAASLMIVTIKDRLWRSSVLRRSLPNNEGHRDPLTDALEPEKRQWLLSQAAPHVWAAAFVANLDLGQTSALHSADSAAAMVEKIKHMPPAEFESVLARSGLVIEEQDFRSWYFVCDNLRNGRSPEYEPPGEKQLQDAYVNYQRGLGDFY